MCANFTYTTSSSQLNSDLQFINSSSHSQVQRITMKRTSQREKALSNIKFISSNTEQSFSLVYSDDFKQTQELLNDSQHNNRNSQFNNENDVSQSQELSSSNQSLKSVHNTSKVSISAIMTSFT